MTCKNYSLIPVLAAIAMIPQLLFWWLAPVTADACVPVYIGGTILTVGIPMAYLMTYWNSNLRRTAGLSIVCCVLETSVVAVSALLFWFDASFRSAVFAFIITTLLCMIVLIPWIDSVLKQQRQGVYPAAISRESIDQPMRDNQNYSDRTSDSLPHSSISSHMSQQAPANKPLPPRNR